ncbi:glycosyl transferase [Actinoplanes sp. SE50]|uniref:GT4 family glycosyltransferase PelF n=1 Tax=unclassified Actinoplanes TaxID=2626549 RepID=UPI00023EBC90|nr:MULTISPECIES: GT4 family glycosyltransferase PelF [unclassified Actinoplanes]AEV81248.1 Glycogen synthase [Actinoplanes sp. SE50/110]ATO79651.1 glycosyl transferase [Actinoplanes sp. SE50]SLL97054.1 glycosyl transferase [Actinoplanes sp. SE50/110]
MKVALLTEGTYPHSMGGVSVWCDQLLRGLKHHEFDVYAIVASGVEPAVWELPANVTAHGIALWPPVAGRPRSRTPRTAERLASAYGDLIEALLLPSESAADAFAAALRGIVEHAASETVGTDLSPYGEMAVSRLLKAWAANAALSQVAVPSVLDALTAVDVIERSLRPLLHPTPRADVTHAVTNGLAALPGLAAKWRYGTPMLLTEHGVYLRERYLGLRAAEYNWPIKATLAAFLRLLCTTVYRSADLVAPGNKYNRRWETKFGAHPELIETVYNGVEPDDFPTAGAEPEAPTVTWAGRVDPIKDLETLIRSFALVHAEMPEARLRIFGGTPAGAEGYRQRCEALVVKLGLAGAATFEGRVAEIRDAYAAGHVVALSSISEGFPYTLIEAMTSGRATVSTDVGGVSEAVGSTGLVVPPRDPEAMAAACLALLRDDTRRRELGRQARERALANFTVDKAVDSYDAIYHDLAFRQSRRLENTAVADTVVLNIVVPDPAGPEAAGIR